MPSLRTPPIDLHHTFESGQLFRYSKEGDWWHVEHGDKHFQLRTQGDRLHFEGNVDERYLRHFLRLDDDLDAIFAKYNDDPVLREAHKRFRGLRILRQDPWECTVSFLCSSASNIPKIKRNVRHLSQAYGQRTEFHGKTVYGFAPLGSLTDMKVLQSAGTGFRARYIHGTNRLLAPEIIEEIKRLPYAQAKERLMEFPGIGEKVADCILLFGYSKMEAFPVDVWMERIMKKIYLRGRTTTPKKIAEYARKKFGQDAGYVQQYLFYQSRLEGA